MNMYSITENDEILFDLRNFSKNPPSNIEQISRGTNFWQGKTHTDETKKILKELNTGENNPMFGKKLTTEQKRRITDKQLGKPLSKSHKLSISVSKIGKPRSEETKRKISESRKGQKLSEETKNKISIAKIKK